MLCTNCYREALEGAVFCNHCGTHLQEICDNCDTLNPLDSRFCSRCGLSLSSGLQGAESPIYHQPPISSPVQSASCPRCQKINEQGSTYCYSCGLPLDELADSLTTTYTQNSPSSSSIQAGPSLSEEVVPSQLAGFWIRLGSCLSDVGLMSITLYILGITLLEVHTSEYTNDFGYAYALGRAFSLVLTPILPVGDSLYTYTETGSWTWLDGVDLIIPLAYITVAVSVWSTTIGKRIFGLYVVRVDGSKVGFGRAIARHLCCTVSMLILGIGFLMIALRDDKRGLHDLICDTMVIRQ